MLNDGRPFLTSQMHDLGWTRKQFYDARRAGELRVLFHGCVVDGRVADSRRLRIEAVDLVRPPHAVACSETAAFLYGVNTYKPSERFELRPSFVVPHAATRIIRSEVRCRQALIDDADLTMIEGIAVTTPTRTTSDLLRGLYRPYALAAADGFARAGLIDPDEVVDHVQRRKGYRWIIQARNLAALIDGRAESPGESWHRLRIHDAGFPRPEVQHHVDDSSGVQRRIDLAYPDLMIGSEYDGREHHTKPDDVLRDALRRDDLTAMYGWRWVNADRNALFGPDPAFERELGRLLGVAPILPRRWGNR